MEKEKKEKKNVILSPYEKKQKNLDILYSVLPVFSVLALIVFWICLSNASEFPGPAAVWERMMRLFEIPIKNLNIFGHLWASLKRVMIALLFCWTFGLAFGIMLGWNQRFRAFFEPMFSAFRAIPPLAWIPLITLWFGIGEFPKVLIVIIGGLPPVVVNTQAGIANVQDIYMDVGTIFHANKRQMLLQIALPSALDAIFAGIKNSTSSAWMVVLAAEMLGGRSGVGFLISRGMDSMDMPMILMAMIAIGIVSAILAVILNTVERMVCPWLQKKK